MRLQKRVLKNGMTVIYEKRNLPLVSLSISNKFGASFESSEIKGIAHFIEHLVFTGTKKRTHEDISREIEKRGGILNAFTSQDITSFWFKLPSKHLFAGLNILTDMLNNAVFEESKFEKEKKVILEEIKMYNDMPQKHVYDKIEENLYKKPFGESVIGSEKTIKSLTRDFVFKYFKEHYNPKNYIVTIIGDANLNKVCEFLENNFVSTGTKFKHKEIFKQNKNSVEKRNGIDQAHFIFAFHAPEYNSKEYFALDVLDAYIANGMSSRLFLEIREKRGLAYSVASSLNSEKNYSYYTIYVGTTKKAIPIVKKLILEEFKKIEDNMTEKDLKESKERLIGLKKVSSEESISVMNALAFSELINKAEDFYLYEKRINEIKLKDVIKIAKIKDYSTAAIVPK